MEKITLNRCTKNDVLETRLLSLKEFVQYRDIIPPCLKWWWLSSPAILEKSAPHVAFVSYRNYVNSDAGSDVNCGDGGIRPAFVIKNLDCDVGQKVLVGRLICTVLNDNTVLSDWCCDESIFDADSNDYEKSVIKEYINTGEFLKSIGLTY